MDELATGDRVLSINPSSGRPEYSEVFYWLHYDRTSPANYGWVTIHSEAGLNLSTSAHHYVHVLPGGCFVPSAAAGAATAAAGRPAEWSDAVHLVARDVRAGDGVWVLDTASGSFACSRVVAVERDSREVGLYMPMTWNDNILVDGISACPHAPPGSCAAAPCPPMNWLKAPKA